MPPASIGGPPPLETDAVVATKVVSDKDCVWGLNKAIVDEEGGGTVGKENR